MLDPVGACPSTRQWNGLGEYLARPTVRLLSEPTRQRLLAEWTDITGQESQLEDALLIGLVGGTGVGKSTFINALAGEVVSRSSDRRPTTDRVVIYRHADTELPADVPTDDLAQPQVLHRRGELAKVILFDFPDFDSAEVRHTQVLRKYLEHLDVLLIVVDDMKYADRRLYELISSLDHAEANLFVLLNKIDRLQLRYGDTTKQVVEDLTSDVREKFAENAGIALRADQLFPISAGEVLRARISGVATDFAAGFANVERLLTDFQWEKHRRRAKEQNIDSRKARLAAETAQLALGEENQSILVETRELLTQWQLELTNAIEAIPQEVLIDRERRSLQKSRLRRRGPAWGFPFSFAFTLLSERPWSRRDDTTTEPGELAGRVHQHYRGFFEAVRNLQARYRAEFVGSEVTAQRGPEQAAADQWASGMAARMRTTLHEMPPDVTKMGKMLCHLPAMGVLVFAIWSCIYRMFDADYGFFKGLGVALLSAINPSFLLGLLLSIVLVYFLAAGALWIRELQVLNEQVARAEQGVREDVLARRDQVLARLDADVTSLANEYEEVAALVEKTAGSSAVPWGCRILRVYFGAEGLDVRQLQFAEFDFRPLGLQGDLSLSGGAIKAMVDQVAVHPHLDLIPNTLDDHAVPLTEWLF